MARRGPALDKTGLAADLLWLRSHYTTAHSLCSPGIWLRGSVSPLPPPRVPTSLLDFVLAALSAAVDIQGKCLFDCDKRFAASEFGSASF